MKALIGGEVNDMRYVAMALLVVAILIGCSEDDQEVVVMKDAERCFPMELGDKWYFTFGSGASALKVSRTVSEEVDSFGTTCTAVYDELGQLEECWRIDSLGFWVHLFGVYFVPEPPLQIPFNMRSDRPHRFDSELSDLRNFQKSPYKGKLTFVGYVSKTVPAGTFDDCIKLRYDVEGDQPYSYYEYYAPDVGLLDNGDLVLDSAVVGGIRYPLE